MPVKYNSLICIVLYRTTVYYHVCMETQLAHTLLMVEPSTFGYNPQTAKSNTFQHKATESDTTIQRQAMLEFTEAVSVLRSHGIHVLVLPSPGGVVVPDAVFPNNWFSIHDQKTLVVYPMLAANRRLERQPLALVKALAGTLPELHVLDLAHHEAEHRYLEGTGSLVLDRIHDVAFAVISPRTDEGLVREWGDMMGYRMVPFYAETVADHAPIYHTNVLMTIGNGFCVIGTATIPDGQMRQDVEHDIESLGLERIDITPGQVASFCGNMLAVLNTQNIVKLILSETAFHAFTDAQRRQLSRYGELVPLRVPTIERVGGGSARCMIAEIC